MSPKDFEVIHAIRIALERLRVGANSRPFWVHSTAEQSGILTHRIRAENLGKELAVFRGNLPLSVG